MSSRTIHPTHPTASRVTVDTTVTGGVDTHSQTHHAAVLDHLGLLLATRQFPATGAGYQALLAWLNSFGTLERVGVEGTSSYGAGLTRHLISHGVWVIEVNRPNRQARRQRGKSDPLDAENAARRALSGEQTIIPKDTSSALESIRTLRIARSGAVKARTAGYNQLKDILITAPEDIRDRWRGKTLYRVSLEAARLRPDTSDLHHPDTAVKIALRSIARRIAELTTEITELDRLLAELVNQVAPTTLELVGVGVETAAQLLTTAGPNIDRFRGEASFAALCAASPIPASSGKTHRHRLNPGGDRAANKALHTIALVRMRYCPRTQTYIERRMSEGLSKREAIRALKRYIARDLYHSLVTDLTRPLDDL